MYASVLIEIGAKSVDKLFTYIIPSNLINDVKIGIRVKVPFGSMTLEGFVLEIKSVCEENYELKEIISLVDTDAILNPELLYLGKKIKEMTLCSLISAYQAMLPKALKAKNKVNINIKKDRYIILNKEKDIIIEYINQTKYKKQKEKSKTSKIETFLTDDEIKKYELMYLKEYERELLDLSDFNHYPELSPFDDVKIK